MSTSSDERRPVVFANYPGDRTKTTNLRMGPNTLGEYLYVVEAVYDKETKKTKLGFSYMPPREQVSPQER